MPARPSCAPRWPRCIAEEGLGIDVCTAGELAIALRAGVDPERIALHGNNKSVAELRAGARGRGRPDRAGQPPGDRSAGRAGRRRRVRVPKVLVRVTVGVEAHTHEFIATAHEDQKFGFSLASGQALAAVASVLDQSQPGTGRPALAHRLADLRHRRLRGRRAPGDRPAGRDPGQHRPGAARDRPGRRAGHRLRRRRRPAVAGRDRRPAARPSSSASARWPASRCHGWRWNRAGRSSARP